MDDMQESGGHAYSVEKSRFHDGGVTSTADPPHDGFEFLLVVEVFNAKAGEPSPANRFDCWAPAFVKQFHVQALNNTKPTVFLLLSAM